MILKCEAWEVEVTYILNDVNHIVNFDSYVLPTLEAILFNCVGSRNTLFFPLA